jgi:CHAT domain-containing protein
MTRRRLLPGLVVAALACGLAAAGVPAAAQSGVKAGTSPVRTSPGSAPVSATGAGLFAVEQYRPAVLRLAFSPAKGRTVNSEADAFLDMTLIPPEGQLLGFRTEVSSKQFSQLLRRLYAQLASQEPLKVEDPASPARQLDAMLMQPAAEQLRRLRISTLLISAETGLQAVPFAALHDGQTFFGERYGFSLTPSLGLTRLGIQTQPGGSRLLAAGASQFEGLNPLPLVPQELEQITRGKQVASYLNRDFTPELLIEKAADPAFNRVHVATHAEFVPGGPAAARLYTGVAPMSLRQLAQMRQRRGDAQLDLFTLSACRTALGDADSELGFAGLALQAGSQSAIGSLWYVDDVATSALFVQFYRFLDQGMPKAEALQFTRRAMATGAMKLVKDQVIGANEERLLSGLTTAQQRRIAGGLQHPFYWAGIQLLGTPW